MLKAIGGIETELKFEKDGVSMEYIADKLDHGYRGIIAINVETLNDLPQRSRTFIGKLAKNIPIDSAQKTIEEKHYTEKANHCISLECAVRDMDTGELKGFYVCDSGVKERRMYVEKDLLQEAFHVKGGAVVFTDKAFLNK